MKINKLNKNGFSLIELSFVLIIIGLIAAVIVTRTEITENTRRNVVISDFKKYEVAYNQFKEKYLAVPGDSKSPLKLIGCSSCIDGNDNGLIDFLRAFEEAYDAWKQLAFTGFIEGAYPGKPAGGGGAETEPEIGKEIPAAPYDGAAYILAYHDFSSYDLSPVNSVTVGIKTSTVNVINGNFLSSEQASLIDQKIDDGFPLTGRLFGEDSTYNDSPNSNCYNFGGTEDLSVTTYSMSQVTNSCYLIYFFELPGKL